MRFSYLVRGFRAVVFTYGMRVLNLVDEPPQRAAVPGGAEKQ